MKSYFFRWLIAAGSLLLALPEAKAQCALVLHGQITMNGDDAAAGASVRIRGIHKTVLADSAGKYNIGGLCRGTYQIEISRSGCKTLDTTVQVEEAQELNIVLGNMEIALDSIVVTTSERRSDQQATLARSTISGMELEKTRGVSLGEALKSIAGVNTLQTGPSIFKPVIHGVYSNRILILNNGVRQEGQNWGNDHAPEIDPFIATRLTVIKGASSIRYGSDAIGGVVLVEPKELRKLPGIDGNINLAGISNGRAGVASAMIEGAADTNSVWNGLSARLQGTIKQAGNAQAPDYYLKNTGYGEKDYSAALQYNRKAFGASIYYSRFYTKLGIAAASHIGTLSDLYNAFAAAQPAEQSGFTYNIARPYQEVDHQLFKLNTFINLGVKAGKLEGIFAKQIDVRKEYDADISFNDSIANLNPPDLYFKLITHTATIVWKHPSIGKQITGSLGIDFITHGNVQESTGYAELIPNFLDYGGGLFLLEQWPVHSRLLLEAGVRYDDRWLKAYTVNPSTLAVTTPTYSWQHVSGSAGVSYKLSQRLSADINIGTAWRAPQVIELFANGIHQSAASYEHGDPNLTLEKALNSNFSLQYSAGKWHVEAGVYCNYFHHYIYLRPDSLPVQTIQGAFPSFTYTQVNALFTGSDITIDGPVAGPVSWTSRLSVVRARNLQLHNWLINIPSDRLDNTLKYSLPAWKKIRQGYISLHQVAVARQSRVPPKSDYVAPPAGYVLYGIDAGCSLPVGHRYIDISCSVNNLTNVTYRDYLDRFRYFIDAPGRNITVRLLIPFDSSKGL